MAFNEVNNLRKSGQIEAALSMALADYEGDPNNIWNKRGLGWVYFEQIKSVGLSAQFQNLPNVMDKIIELSLPQEEQIYWEQISWQIGKAIFWVQKNAPANLNHLDRCFECLKKMPLPRPSESFSFLLKAFHRANKTWTGYIELLDWWGLENLRAEDYLPEEMPDGKSTMSLAEQVIVAYARILSEMPESRERIVAFMPLLDQVVHDHPEYQYPPYYKGKLLLCVGDKENVLAAFLPFARKKQSEFWVWDLLSETFPEDDPRHIACLSQALTCRTEEKFLGKVRLKMAERLISQKKFQEAKTEVEIIANTYATEGWKLMPEAKAIQDLSWYHQTLANPNNLSFYNQFREMAEEIVFGDLPEQVIVVDFVNTEKEILHFVAENGTHGSIKYGKKLRKVRIGDLLLVRFDPQVKNEQYKPFSIKNAPSDTTSSIKKTTEGIVSIRNGQAFGFLDNIFIDPDMVNKNKLSNGTKISITAIQSWHKKRNELTWKAIHLSTIT